MAKSSCDLSRDFLKSAGSRMGDAKPYKPAKDFGRKFPARPELLVNQVQVRNVVLRQARYQGRMDDNASSTILVSIRSWEEYLGLTSGCENIEACGEIASALR